MYCMGYHAMSTLPRLGEMTSWSGALCGWGKIVRCLRIALSWSMWSECGTGKDTRNGDTQCDEHWTGGSCVFAKRDTLTTTRQTNFCYSASSRDHRKDSMLRIRMPDKRLHFPGRGNAWSNGHATDTAKLNKLLHEVVIGQRRFQ